MHATVGESLHGVVGERWAVEVVVVTRPTGGLPPVRPLAPRDEAHAAARGRARRQV